MSKFDELQISKLIKGKLYRIDPDVEGTTWTMSSFPSEEDYFGYFIKGGNADKEFGRKRCEGSRGDILFYIGPTKEPLFDREQVYKFLNPDGDTVYLGSYFTANCMKRVTVESHMLEPSDT